jgi:ubiquinone/menaquinone biosynthesis C-methylase UbiE
MRVPGHQFDRAYTGDAAENYQRYFVPAIGAPVADHLLKVAALRPNERVLDVACGTGVVTRQASELVGQTGVVAGLDVNPGMLVVARATTPPGTAIEWHEASAEEMPFPAASFDAVLCQMGLQFIPHKEAALSEMRRVLAPGGRLIINLPGPTPPAFGILAEALARHIGPQAEGFVNQVFSLHDTAEIQSLLSGAGFPDVSAETHDEPLSLPAPEEFLWQFVHSTPLAAAVAGAEEERLTSLERDVVAKWQPFVDDHALVVKVRMVTATARKV